MTITIRTADLVGILTDVIPFAADIPELPHINAVRMEWDGEMLHAEATDTLHAARSSWHPDDDASGSSKQATAFDILGGADNPWALIVRYDEAKEIVKDYRLPTKEADCLLTLDYNRGALTIRRSRDTGHAAKQFVAEGRMVEFPRVGAWLDGDMVQATVQQIQYSGAVFARVGQVRQRGLMRMVFGTKWTRVTIGDRFVATLSPDRSGERSEQPALAGV